MAGRRRANPAAGLHLQAALTGKCTDQFWLRDPAFLRAIEIDHVQPRRPGGLEFRCGFERVDGVIDLSAVIALLQTHDFSATEIDGGHHDKGHGGVVEE